MTQSNTKTFRQEKQADRSFGKESGLKSQEPVWPNFFIVGAPKCGTTSLYDHLKTHPQVFFPEVKEPNFFIAPEHSLSYLGNIELQLFCYNKRDMYCDLYEGGRGYPAVGDATPNYLANKHSPGLIHQVRPNAKIVIILRDPVVRAHSHFLMNASIGEDTPPFQSALMRDYNLPRKGLWFSQMYVEAGMYYEQVHRYISTFGRDNVAVYMFNDLKNNPQHLFSSVARHIGIDPGLLNKERVAEARNVYRMPRSRWVYNFTKKRKAQFLIHNAAPRFVQQWLESGSLLYDTQKPPMEDESRQFLQNLYDPDISKLEDLLGTKLPDLRESWR